MSRIGKRPITLPKGVEFSRAEDGSVTIKGPKGVLVRQFHPDIQFRLEEGTLYVERPSEGKMHRSLHGLTRTLAANMVQGVTSGFTRELEIQGVGFRAQMVGAILQINAGYSHSLEVMPREGVTFSVANDPQSRTPIITITGIDKEIVGRTAAEIRRLRKPEPYKGKGIRYRGEQVRRKQGKAGGKGGKGKKK